MKSSYGGPEQGSPYIRWAAAARSPGFGDRVSVDRAASLREAAKISYAVRDLISFANQPEGRRLYGSLLPLTLNRLAAATNVLADPLQDVDIRQVVAQPLREIFDPGSGVKWYDRVVQAQRIASLNPAIMRGYEQFDREQEHSQNRETNRRSQDFLRDFLDTAIDVGILQRRLQAVYHGQVLSPGLPLDMWIYQTVQGLQTFPIEDLRKIGDHPIGGQLLAFYREFDKLLQAGNVQMV